MTLALRPWSPSSDAPRGLVLDELAPFQRSCLLDHPRHFVPNPYESSAAPSLIVRQDTRLAAIVSVHECASPSVIHIDDTEALLCPRIGILENFAEAEA